MAEFDTQGFAAVDKFFGASGDGISKDSNEVAVNQSSSAKISALSGGGGGHRRGGVGALKQSQPQWSSGNSNLERVLKVSRKKKRSRQDLEDEDNHSLQSEHNDDDDDNVEEGRTAIVKDSKKKATATEITIAASSKNSKKKKGKKERQRLVPEEDASNENEHPTAGTEDSANLPEAPVLKTDDPGVAAGEDVAPSNTKDNDSSNKRNKSNKRRRKVRSRQKNIRKDTRTMADKPAHLIPGNPNYLGRPMTQATRERLKHPVSTGKNMLMGLDGSSRRGNTFKAKATSDASSIPKTKQKQQSQEGSAKEQEQLFVIDRGNSNAPAAEDDVGVVL